MFNKVCSRVYSSSLNRILNAKDHFFRPTLAFEQANGKQEIGKQNSRAL